MSTPRKLNPHDHARVRAQLREALRTFDAGDLCAVMRSLDEVSRILAPPNAQRATARPAPHEGKR